MRSTSLCTAASTMAGRLLSNQSFSIGRSISATMASTVLPLTKGISVEEDAAGSGFLNEAARPAKAEAALAAALSPTNES
jgi:hypothetical protein